MRRAFFLSHPESGSQRFCIHHEAQGPRRGRVVYLHPFVEEMNKSRRMVALQARALAAAGFAVLQIDLAGCGDSAGDFGDASWDGWIDDAVLAAQWLRAHDRADDAAGPLWFWGLRAGALLATAAAARLDEPAHFLFWQPATQGKLQMQQFLRLKAAAELAAGAKGVTEKLRAQLDAGAPVEIAGYMLAPALANGLAAAKLETPAQPARVVWLELSTQEPAELLPASQAPLQRLREAGFTVTAEVVTGPAFWQTTEIETAPALIERTIALLGGGS